MQFIVRCGLLQFICVCVCATLAAQDLPPGILLTKLGVTRNLTPIEAWVSIESLNVNSSKRNIVLVGGLDGSPRTTAAVQAWIRQFAALPEQNREQVSLSGILCGNPEGLRQQLINANGAGGNPARGYPPPGEAYRSPTDPEAQYLWRWLGMQGPDLVIELIDGDVTGPVEPTTRPVDSLAAGLSQHPVGGIGTIQANVWTVADQAKLPMELLMQTVAMLPREPASGSARYELQRRVQRTPLVVSEQLAQVYGRDLPTPAYIPAVACLARLRLSSLNGDQSIVPDLQRIVKPYYSGEKTSLTEKSSGSDIAGHILWGELFDATRDPRYIQLAQAAADRAFDQQGLPREAMPTHSEMSDSVFMGCPILAQVGRLTGDSKYWDMCLKHMRFMLKLNLRADGLHRHSPLDETAWGRGNGFPALGLALALEDLPKSHPGRQEMEQAFRTHLLALLPHQDPTGAWHQVIDHPESYRELTSTCMITYAMIRGVRRGVLDEATFRPAIDRAWTAIKLRVGDDGALVDVCTGTGKMKSLREYLDRTAILGRDPRGGAMSLLIATEMANSEK